MNSPDVIVVKHNINVSDMILIVKLQKKGALFIILDILTVCVNSKF
jgi:hypothetical protein